MFHVEQRLGGGNQAPGGELFHVEHSRRLLHGPNWNCSTWNTDMVRAGLITSNQEFLLEIAGTSLF